MSEGNKTKDVKNADTETIPCPYNKNSEDPDSEYSENVIKEIAIQLALHLFVFVVCSLGLYLYCYK